jgi:hypothetical protein
MATLENPEPRIATMEAVLADALSVIKTIGATQSVVADALRGYSGRMGSVESVPGGGRCRWVGLGMAAARSRAWEAGVALSAPPLMTIVLAAMEASAS